jgi:hypothetical protein
VVALFVLLLIIFFAAFFGLDQFSQAMGVATTNNDILLGTISGFQISLSRAGVRTVLGGGIVFFELLIIIMSVFDRIMDTIKATVRPLATLVPLTAFLYSVYNTFRPIVMSLLPAEIGGGNAAYIAQAVNDPVFNQNVLSTFGLMLLFLLMARILGGDSAEVRRLRAKLKQYEKYQKRQR